LRLINKSQPKIRLAFPLLSATFRYRAGLPEDRQFHPVFLFNFGPFYIAISKNFIGISGKI
jgi:hypothetical protein